jgi:hypothetical protein
MQVNWWDVAAAGEAGGPAAPARPRARETGVAAVGGPHSRFRENAGVLVDPEEVWLVAPTAVRAAATNAAIAG